MKPGCCFMNAASDAQATCSSSASSGSTVKVLIRITEPTCSSICSKSDTYLSISTNCGIYFLLLGSWGRQYGNRMPPGVPRRLRPMLIHWNVEKGCSRKPGGFLATARRVKKDLPKGQDFFLHHS